MASKTLYGPTPNGGVKSTLVYLDSEWNEADEETATQLMIVEYDEKGESIFRTYAEWPPSPAPGEDSPDALTDPS